MVALPLSDDPFKWSHDGLRWVQYMADAVKGYKGFVNIKEERFSYTDMQVHIAKCISATYTNTLMY